MVKIKKYKKLFIILAIIISGLLLYISSNKDIVIHLISFFILIFTSCIVVKFDIFHPYVWYNIFFGIYSCAYPILYYMNIYNKYGYSKISIFYSWLSLVVINLIIPVKKIKLKKINCLKYKNKIIENFNNLIQIFVFSVMIFIVNSSKYTHKNIIYSDNNIFLKLAFSLTYFIILVYAYNLSKKLNLNLRGIFFTILKTAFVVGMVSIITGERDYLFSYLLITILLLFHYKKIKIISLILIAPLGIILLPLTSSFKYFILTGKIFKASISNNIFLKFLDGEFISAGRNLQILVSNNCYNIFKGKMLLNDFIRVFYSTGVSHQIWFNQVFFPLSKHTKYGFTLTGEGYVNGGILGVIFVFILVGLIIRYLYLNSNKSFYNMALYLYMIPLFIYSSRADIANIISPLLKYGLFGITVIWILEYINFKKGVKGK